MKRCFHGSISVFLLSPVHLVSHYGKSSGILKAPFVASLPAGRGHNLRKIFLRYKKCTNQNASSKPTRKSASSPSPETCFSKNVFTSPPTNLPASFPKP